ncbi:MFS general substrate transporter [Melanomma pulvis-pyrius CBS 109.77]|uniref:MFS general substrate transporter n=1 Tax=Melanomma pulvis-pyrius CBS 109.77 TaxID=1314802 RepID=A0A6A6XSC2_9PLEO|nr:MFS general substrate transporter [Melanomma pulvis-pyrius CBS 109.77]
MADIIRDAPVGQLIRFLTRNKYLQYPEERPDFELPAVYRTSKIALDPLSQFDFASSNNQEGSEAKSPAAITAAPLGYHITMTELNSPIFYDSNSSIAIATLGLGTFYQSSSSIAIDQISIEAFPTSGQESSTALTRPYKETVLADWYTTDDPENPQNWSFGKKAIVAAQICLYTLAFYMGSSIYTPSYPGIMERFDVDTQAVSLGLSMYVVAYGIGPMIFSPLSEIPSIGRNPPYLITFGIFVILLVPTALTESFAGLVTLRFLQGFFGSPCLATGGATLQDMYSLLKLPYALVLWAFAATSGPALGPIISGFSVAAKDWRWSLWEMLWLSGPIWIFMFVLMPETSSAKILLRRGQRLRRLTGNERIKSQSEIDQANTSFKEVLVEALWRPHQMMLLDPSIAFTALYTALIYGIFYSFFEAFPMVYQGMYGFNPGEMGLTFLSVLVGATISASLYVAYLFWIVEPEIKSHGLGAPEGRLIPALYASFCFPAGLFIFAWTTTDPRIHWIASVIGIGIFTIGQFIILQCIFLYIALSYPKYAASLFAGNDFTRSILAAGTIHFSQPLYHNLGPNRGVTLLGGLTCACIAGIFALWRWGGRLRARSRFAAS